MDPESNLNMENKEENITKVKGNWTVDVRNDLTSLGLDIEAELTKILIVEINREIKNTYSLTKIWNSFKISKNIGTYIDEKYDSFHHSIQTFKNDDTHGVRVKFKHEE